MEQLPIDPEALNRALPYLGVTLGRWQSAVRSLLTAIHADGPYDPIRCGPVLMNSAIYLDRGWIEPICAAFEQVRANAASDPSFAKWASPLADLGAMHRALEIYRAGGEGKQTQSPAGQTTLEPLALNPDDLARALGVLGPNLELWRIALPRTSEHAQRDPDPYGARTDGPILRGQVLMVDRRHLERMLLGLSELEHQAEGRDYIRVVAALAPLKMAIARLECS